jgi:hypothetical protein
MTLAASRAGAARAIVSTLVVWCAVLGLPGSIPAAHAADGDSFDQQVADAQSRYLAHDYEGAIVKLEEAYRQKPIARLLFNMGMAHRKAGHLREALDLFERYRVARGAGDRDVPVDRYIEELQQRIASTSPPPVAPALAAPPPAAPDPQATLTRAPLEQPAKADTGARPGVLHRWWLWTAAGAVIVAAVGAVLLLRTGGSNGPCAPGVKLCEPFP